jgi:hypothetical protein
VKTLLRLAIVIAVIGLSWSKFAKADDKQSAEITALRKVLTFYASFNKGIDAEVAEGDPQLFTALTLGERANGKPGLPDSGAVAIAKGAGRFGDSLQFKQPGPQVVFYQIAHNLAYAEQNWSGAISVWLKLDPDKDLAPGYVDPLFITPRTYDDGALWIDFTDNVPRQFRHGAVADRKVWDPQGRGFGQTPAAELPVATVMKPPFANEAWTHVVISFSNFNTGRPDGISTLYLNGEPAGTVGPREQTFMWNTQRATVCLGISYTGLIDELAFFDRALTPEEVRMLFEFPRPLSEASP